MVGRHCELLDELYDQRHVPRHEMRDDTEPARSRTARLTGMSLLTRIFLTNAAVLAAAVLVLVLTPVTVSDPVVLREAVVLVAGLTVILIVNLLLFRRAFAPLVRLTDLMRTIDLLRPGRRIPVYGGDAEVANLTLAFNEMLDRLEAERRQSARRSLTAQEDERRRVAQELHDEIGQSLTAVVLQLERAGRRAPEELRRELIEARETARASLEEVRQIAQRLRPEALDELGLRSALAALAERVSDRGGLQVVRHLDGGLPALSPEAELVIYRVAQESLTNALRHADASQAVLTLRRNPEGVTLGVTDDGRGLDGTESGAGIQGMRERALLIGARLELRTRVEGGAEVRLDIPAETE
jgi:two-component system sensor histidine kinase UhpB